MSAGHDLQMAASQDAGLLVERFRGWLLRWGRRLILLSATLLLLGGSASPLTSWLFSGHVVGGPGLQRVKDAETFTGLLKIQNGNQWPSAKDAVLPGKNSVDQKPTAAGTGPSAKNNGVSLIRFRIIQSLDSFLIVPGYVLLFMLEYLVLALCLPSRLLPRRLDNRLIPREIALHAACFLPVAAGIFDLAENVVTLNAAEDAVSHVLADETVEDLFALSAWKWGLLGLSLLVLGFMAWKSRQAETLPETNRRLLLVTAGAALAAALALLVFYSTLELVWLYAGTAGLGVALGAGAWVCLWILKPLRHRVASVQ